MIRIALLFLSLTVSSVSFAQVSGNSIQVRTPRYRHDNYNQSYNQEDQYLSPVYGSSVAKTPHPVIINDSTFSITASVLLNRGADSYTAILGISQMGETIETAHSLINERVNNLLSSLSAVGIDKEKVYIDVISQLPVFETEVEKKLFTRSYNEKPLGFEVRKNIHIPFEDISKLDPLLASAAKSEIYDIVKVEFYVRDIESIYDTLRSEAIRIIKEKESSFAKLGIKSTPLFQTAAESYHAIYPEDLYRDYTSHSSSSLSQKESSLSYEKLKQATQPVSYYYEKTSYSSFDKVIKPEIVAPAAQFTYSLTLRYIVKRQ